MTWDSAQAPADNWSKVSDIGAPDYSLLEPGAPAWEAPLDPGKLWIKGFGNVVITFWDLNTTEWDVGEDGQPDTIWDIGLSSEGWNRL